MPNKDYKTHSLEEYNKVIKLKNLGLNPTQICSFLLKNGMEIKYNTFYDWIHYKKKPFQDKVISKIPEESKVLTKEKGYVLGVLCGDGKKLIGYKNPDFIAEDKKLIIEVFLDYFKKREFGSVENYIKCRRDHFAKYGYITIFISQKEITSENWENICLDKIKEKL